MEHIISMENLPTKYNLSEAVKGLKLATQGLDLLDKKQKILVMTLGQIHKHWALAQENLVMAIGHSKALTQEKILRPVVEAMPSTAKVKVLYTNLAGVPLPTLTPSLVKHSAPPYNLGATTTHVDNALVAWQRTAVLLVQLSQWDIQREIVSTQLKKTQKRIGALKNIVIPTYQEKIKHISNQLEERERDEFVRTKNAIPPR